MTYAVFTAMALCCLPLMLPKTTLDLPVAAFTALVVAIGVSMGVGKASVYRYVPDYFPKDVGAVGGLVGCLGGIGGAVLMPLFGQVETHLGIRQSAFVLLFVLVVVSFAWLHLVVLGIKRSDRTAPALAETA